MLAAKGFQGLRDQRGVDRIQRLRTVKGDRADADFYFAEDKLTWVRPAKACIVVRAKEDLLSLRVIQQSSSPASLKKSGRA